LDDADFDRGGGLSESVANCEKCKSPDKASEKKDDEDPNKSFYETHSSFSLSGTFGSSGSSLNAMHVQYPE
jgi:hypothetical protein